MTTDYAFRPDLKELARRDFLRAQRIERALSPKRIMRARMEDAVKRRTDGLRKKMAAHFDKNKEKWIAREAEKIKRKNPARLNHSLASGPKPPFGMSYSQRARSENVFARARANVERRAQTRMNNLNKIEQRMTQRLSRSRSRSR